MNKYHVITEKSQLMINQLTSIKALQTNAKYSMQPAI